MTFHAETKADVVDLIYGVTYQQTLVSGLQLGIFEAVDETPRPAAEIAADLDLDPRNGYRLLRALASLGLLTETRDRQFAISTAGAYLQADHPESLRGLGLLNGEGIEFAGHLPDIVRDGGETAPERALDMSFFDLRAASREFAELFDDAMDSYSRLQAPWIEEIFADVDLADVSHLCDIAGGRGHTLSLLLRDRPHIEGTVLEVPGVVEEQDPPWPRAMGVEDRVSYEAGDMFESVPAADCYVMKYILHDWSDEDCQRLLSSIHDDAPEDARLFCLEQILPGDGSPHVAKLLDIQMMTMTGGRERTLAEYRDLLETGGWEYVDVRSSENGRLGAIEAVPT